MQKLLNLLLLNKRKLLGIRHHRLALTTPAMLALLLVGCGDDDSLDENESGQADISVKLSSRDSSTVKINSSWLDVDLIPDTAYVTYTENGETKLSESKFCLLAYQEHDNIFTNIVFGSSDSEGYVELVYANTEGSSASIINFTYNTNKSMIDEGSERIVEGVNQSSLQVENQGSIIFSDENGDIQKIWGSYSLGLNPDCDVDGDGTSNGEDSFPFDACADQDTDNDGRPDSITQDCITDLEEDIDDDFDNSLSLKEMRYPVTINVKLVPTKDAEDLSGKVTITHGKKAGQLIKQEQYSYSDIEGKPESTWLVWPEETFIIENHDDQYRGDLSVIIEVEGEQVCQERVPYVLLTDSFMLDKEYSATPTCTIIAGEEIDVKISLGDSFVDKSISFNTQWTDDEEIACGSDPADANNDPKDSDFDHVCDKFDAFLNDSCASDDVDEDRMPDSLHAHCITNLTLDDEVTIG